MSTDATFSKPEGAVHRRPIGVALALLVPILLATAPAATPQTIKFISIEQNDADTRRADDELRDLLAEELGASLNPTRYGYFQAINVLSEWRKEMGETPYLARVTPYVFIAAEMLGANFEILGTYESRATSRTTYHSYFVVNREAFDATVPVAGRQPDPDDVLAFIRTKAESARPVRFIYHSRFSTSSYFLPALFFHRNEIFTMGDSGGLGTIRSEDIAGNSSTPLVEEVASGRADLAAVWDGTKVKFKPGGAYPQVGAKVYFIQLPTALPNDLLVGSRSLGDEAKAKIRRAFAPSVDRARIDTGDFVRWVDIQKSDEALEALAALRWRAHEPPARVTVKIEKGDDRITDGFVEAARQAVRLSGTEFALYDPSFHEMVDYEWTLKSVREGHLILASKIPGFGVDQEFRISFQPAGENAEENDLTQRIGNLVDSRLHRVRYVWPYDEQHPAVIRDVPFSLAAGTEVKVQRIIWNDPLHNDYSIDDRRDVEIRSADFYKFRLAKEDVAATSLEPMSKVAYRVLLVRPDEPETMFAVFNGVFYALVTLSLAGTFVAFRRAAPPAAEPPDRQPLAVVREADDDRRASR